MEVTANSPRVEHAQRAAAQNPHWYHTLELAPGVLTGGQIDLRRVAPRLLPAAMDGQRALDVGTFDGFWAFELERRGAVVTGLDVPRVDAAEWPPIQRERLIENVRAWDVQLGRGFAIAAELLRSEVHRVECSVYDLTADMIGGEVDFAFAGAILLHLRDPVRALERIHAALRPGGTVTILEPFSIRETVLSPRGAAASFRAAWSDFTWWLPNLQTLQAWLAAAGFVQVTRRGLYHPPARPEMRQWLAGYTARRPIT